MLRQLRQLLQPRASSDGADANGHELQTHEQKVEVFEDAALELPPEGEAVKVWVCGNRGYVWDPADVRELRLRRRLVGLYVGGLPDFKQQNNVHGLPLTLSAEELWYGLKRGWLVPQVERSPAARLRAKLASGGEAAQQVKKVFSGEPKYRAAAERKLDRLLGDAYKKQLHVPLARPQDKKQSQPQSQPQPQPQPQPHQQEEGPPVEPQGGSEEATPDTTLASISPDKRIAEEPPPVEHDRTTAPDAPALPVPQETAAQVGEDMAAAAGAEAAEQPAQAATPSVRQGSGPPVTKSALVDRSKRAAGGQRKRVRWAMDYEEQEAPEPRRRRYVFGTDLLFKLARGERRSRHDSGEGGVGSTEGLLLAHSNGHSHQPPAALSIYGAAGAADELEDEACLHEELFELDSLTAQIQEEFNFPVTESERRRCSVFASLHSQGYTVTSGAKFGADFLAYGGDPMLYHAHFAVRVLEAEEPFATVAIAAGCRVSAGARKNLVLASPCTGRSKVHEGFLKVNYITLSPENQLRFN